MLRKIRVWILFGLLVMSFFFYFLYREPAQNIIFQWRIRSSLTQRLLSDEYPWALQDFRRLTPMFRETFIPEMLSALSHQKQEVRKRAFWALSEVSLSKETVLKYWGKLLLNQSEQEDFRLEVLMDLVNRKEMFQEVLPLFFELLNDKSFDLRWNTISALGEATEAQPEIVKALLPALRDKNWYIRRGAVNSLSCIGAKEPALVEELILLLEDPNNNVQKRAIRALGKMRAVAAISGLIQTLREEKKLIRWETRVALLEIGSQWNDVSVELIKHSLAENWRLRDEVLYLLDKLELPMIVILPTFLTALKDREIRVQERARRWFKKKFLNLFEVIKERVTFSERQREYRAFSKVINCSELNKK